MTLAITLTVNGDQELAERLASLGPAAKRVAKTALKTAALPIVAAARANITSRTGLLAKGLGARPGRKDRPGRIAVLISSVTTRKTFAKRTGRKVGPGRNSGYRVFYGLFAERGHKIAGSDKRVEPHPWMGPAFAANESAAAQTLEDELLAGIDAEWAKG